MLRGKNLKKSEPLHRLLDVILQKELTIYLNYSILLCAILWNKSLYPWLYEHFTQLYAITGPDGYLWVDYLEEHFFAKDVVEVRNLDSSQLSEINDIISFIEDSIADGNYLTLFIDEYYIPDRVFYLKKHYAGQTFFLVLIGQKGNFNPSDLI